MQDTIAAERRALVQRLRGLRDADWQRPSLCGDWTVAQVVAHLATPFLVSVPAMGLQFLRSGGISAGTDAAARRLAAERDPEDLLTVLEENAASSFRPPGLPLEAPCTDAVCHSADVRWALGDPHEDWADPARLRPVLGFLTGPRAVVGFLPPGRLRGLALHADDVDWQAGRGAPVRGPALALALAALGRREALPQLSGEGVARLAA